MTDNKERDAFEAWAIKRLNKHGLPYFLFAKRDGEYMDGGAQHAWEGWQARAALAASQEKVEPVALRKTFEEWLGEVVADGGCTVEALLVGDTDPIRCARSAWDACVASLSTAPQPSAEAAIRTLEGLGYTYHGGQQWKPPLGDCRVTVDLLSRLDAVRDAAYEAAADVAMKAPITAGMPDDNSAQALAFHASARIRALKSAPIQPVNDARIQCASCGAWTAIIDDGMDHLCEKCDPPQPAEQRKCKAGLYDDCNDDFGCVGCPEPKPAEQPSASPAALTDAQRQQVYEAVALALGNAHDCKRIWSAWQSGTMTEDDFALITESESRIAEIADAAIEVIARLHGEQQ